MDYYSTDIKKIKSYLLSNIADTNSAGNTSVISLKMEILCCFAIKMQEPERKTADILGACPGTGT